MADKCDKCGKSWPSQKLFPCEKCLVKTCLLCQSTYQGPHSAIHDCFAVPQTSFVIELPVHGISRPFTALQTKSWLHGRPVQEVYGLLIDAYRLYAHDLFTLVNEFSMGSIYGGARDSSADLLMFLARASLKRPWMPRWWTAEHRLKCVALGLDHRQFHDLRTRLTPGMVREYYGDESLPMQLRVFSEEVMGCWTLGRSCRGALDIVARKEEAVGDEAASCFEWEEFDRNFATQH